jgi:hypothetical protein
MRLWCNQTGRMHRLGFVLFVVAVAVLAAVAARVESASATVTTLKRFTTPGKYTWTVPTGVTNVTFDVYGASGGDAFEVLPGPTLELISSGGAGGEAKGKFKVHAGEVFEIVVGGSGGAATTGSTAGAAGFNGGGAGTLTVAGGGGGGSDVRLPGRNNGCLSSPNMCGYVDRIIVGGGGGGGWDDGGREVDGECGGGNLGCNAAGGLISGTQESIGGGCSVGAKAGFGFGEAGGSGGGGGGWFGGCSADGAGGGSGYVNPLALSGSFPGGTNQGDGKVIITTTT